MIRSKSMFDKPNPVAEGMRSDLTARPSTSYKRWEDIFYIVNIDTVIPEKVMTLIMNF